MDTPQETIAEALGGGYTARGDAVAIIAALKADNWAIVQVPEGFDPDDVDFSCRVKPRSDPMD